MIFNQEELIELCQRLGIEIVNGNIPLMNGKPITEHNLKDLFYMNDNND